jgi:Ser/Thr protein kinase RdoA (MazF antagonist)
MAWESSYAISELKRISRLQKEKYNPLASHMNEAKPLVQRSILSASALTQQVLPLYDLPGSTTCHFWHHSINDAYLVGAGASRFMLRVSPTRWRSQEQLGAEIDLLHFLHQRHCSVPQPVALRNGSYIHELMAPEGPRYIVLFTLVPGASPHPMTEAASQQFGQAVAKLHRLTDDYPTDCAGLRFDPVDQVGYPLASLESLFTEHRDDYDYLLEIFTDLKQVANKLPRTASAYGICHGDLNASNFHLHDETGTWSLVDFEYFGYGWRIFDVATFFNTQLVDHGQTMDTKRILEAFLAGYQEQSPLSQMELELLPAFVMLRQIWLLGMSVKYIPKSTVGLDMYQRWVFQQVMPFIRKWMKEPW